MAERASISLLGFFLLAGAAHAAATGYTASCPATAQLNIPVVCNVTLTPVPSYFSGSGEVITYKPGRGFQSSITGAYQQSIGSFGTSYLATGTRLGNVSISFTNSQGWADPPPVTINIMPASAPPPTGLQPALVQSVKGVGGGQCCQSITLKISPAAGNTIIVGVGLFANPPVPFSGPTAVDNLGNHFTLDTGINYSYSGTHQYVALLSHVAPAGVTSITVDRNDGLNALMIAIAGEFTNLQSSNPADFMDRFGQDWHSGTPGCPTCWIAGPLATTNSTELIVSMAYTVDNCMYPPGDSVPPYSLVATAEDCPSSDAATMVYTVVNKRGGYIATGSGAYAIVVAGSYKAEPSRAATVKER